MTPRDLFRMAGWAARLAAWSALRGCMADQVLVCPPQCEVEVVLAGSERLRVTCWCDGTKGEMGR